MNIKEKILSLKDPIEYRDTDKIVEYCAELAQKNIDELITKLRETCARAKENQLPWDNLRPFVYVEEINEILNKWNSKSD